MFFWKPGLFDVCNFGSSNFFERGFDGLPGGSLPPHLFPIKPPFFGGRSYAIFVFARVNPQRACSLSAALISYQSSVIIMFHQAFGLRPRLPLDQKVRASKKISYVNFFYHQVTQVAQFSQIRIGRGFSTPSHPLTHSKNFLLARKLAFSARFHGPPV